jgi:hypothetical protein
MITLFYDFLYCRLRKSAILGGSSLLFCHTPERQDVTYLRTHPSSKGIEAMGDEKVNLTREVFVFQR